MVIIKSIAVLLPFIPQFMEQIELVVKIEFTYAGLFFEVAWNLVNT